MCPVTVPGGSHAGTSAAAASGGPRRPSRPWSGPRRRPAAVCSAGVAALITLVVLAAVMRAGGGAGTGPTGASLSWPADGQTSVSVEGLGVRGELGSRGPRTPVPIASVTKVMTAYVVLREHPLHPDGSGPRIRVDEETADESYSGAESTVPVEEGQELDERRLLELMLIPSGNNIARLLARWDAGSEEAFVARMNRAARELGMRDTTYADASGIDPSTVSTSRDQLKLARQVMRDAAFRSVVAIRRTTVPGVPGQVRNTNTLLGEDGVIGVKTGSSTPAGGNLMWAAVARDAGGHRRLLLGVVLHQRAGASPQQGLEAALEASRTLIGSVRRWVSANGPGRT